MIDILSQIWITIFGATAIWLMNGRTDRGRRFGVLCGLAGQPAWYMQLVIHGQWLMVPVYLLYTLAWLRGLRTYWLRRADNEHRHNTTPSR